MGCVFLSKGLLPTIGRLQLTYSVRKALEKSLQDKEVNLSLPSLLLLVVVDVDVDDDGDDLIHSVNVVAAVIVGCR